MSELILDGVTVSRGAGPVIRDVDLTVASGRITALVGPNGAGKTSLLEAISGVIDASAGTIRIHTPVVDENGAPVIDEQTGEQAVSVAPLRKLSRVRRNRAGIVHIEQGRAIFPSLTVLENIRLTAPDQDKVDEVLAMFPELEKRKNGASGLLSGGEQQMVVLARAFASDPKFLLIDEMSLGLAPVVFMRLLPIVQQFADSGVGVLLVEQFTNLALGVADNALVVSSGRVTYSGDAATLKDSPEVLHQAYLGGSSAA